MSVREPGEEAVAGDATVAAAVERLVVRRVGRGLLPLLPLALFGLLEGVLGWSTWGSALPLAGGALVSAVGVVLYGQEVIRRSLGRPGGWPRRIRMGAGFVPYLYGLWVLILRGLRPLTDLFAGTFAVGVAAEALALILLAGLFLRLLVRVSEMHRWVGVGGAFPDATE